MREILVLLLRGMVKARRVPPSVLCVAGGLSMYFGAVPAVVLFTQVNQASEVWLRITGAAVVLMEW
jgi:threonine/homoserine efflux transporter RhtA